MAAIDPASPRSARSVAASVAGHSLPYSLAGAILLALAIAAASIWWDAPRLGFDAIDPVDVHTVGGYWQGQLAAAGAAAVVISLAIGLVARTVGLRAGIVTVPRLWRVKARPTPLLGSLAIIAGIVVGVVVGAPDALGSRKLVGAGVGVLAMAAVGLVDDLRRLTPRTRLLYTAIVAEMAWVVGLRAAAFPEGAVGDVANALLTMLWFVGVTHAFNVFDNMDGASAGVAVASSLSIASLAAVTNQGVVVVLCVAVAGGCLGYLAHNFFPARLYMGDSGALAVGFGVAALGVMLEPPTVRPLGFALPVLAVGVPIFDSALVTVSRMRGRRRIAVGGTDHLTHRLHRAGFGVRALPVVLLCAQVVLGALAIVVASVPRAIGWSLLVVIGCGGVIGLLLLLRLPEWKPDRREASLT